MNIKKADEQLGGVAELSVYSRDIFWNFLQARWTKEGGMEWFKAKWTGYNDRNWWNNVAPSMRRQKCVGDRGTTVVLEIDFDTNLVVEVETKGGEA